MSTDTAADPDSIDLPPALRGLPSEFCGWVQADTHDSYLIEFWRRGSTHIAGRYEHITVSELRDGDFRLMERGYDQFGHQVTSENLTERPPEQADWIWQRAKRRMQQYTGQGEFDGKPEIPRQVGSWDLTSLKHENRDQTVRWELGFGEAELALEELSIESYYSYTRRAHELRYCEPDEDPVVIVTGIPRTSAFEIAVHTLEHLPLPVSHLAEQREDLQTLTGIGPAKSAALLRLGIDSVDSLLCHSNDGTHVNHHHSRAVEKLLTKAVKADLKDREVPSGE